MSTRTPVHAVKKQVNFGHGRGRRRDELRKGIDTQTPAGVPAQTEELLQGLSRALGWPGAAAWACMLTTESHCWTAETSNTVKQPA